MFEPLEVYTENCDHCEEQVVLYEKDDSGEIICYDCVDNLVDEWTKISTE